MLLLAVLASAAVVAAVLLITHVFSESVKLLHKRAQFGAATPAKEHESTTFSEVKKFTSTECVLSQLNTNASWLEGYISENRKVPRASVLGCSDYTRPGRIRHSSFSIWTSGPHIWDLQVRWVALSL